MYTEFIWCYMGEMSKCPNVACLEGRLKSRSYGNLLFLVFSEAAWAARYQPMR